MPNILIFSVVCLLSAYGTSLDQWNIIRSSSAPFNKSWNINIFHLLQQSTLKNRWF